MSGPQTSAAGLRTRTGRTRALLLALFAAHALWIGVRLPGKTVARRLEQVDAWQQLGAARFLLDNEHMHGGAQLEWVREHTPTDAVVLWTGLRHGAIELVQSVLAPRLLVHESACPPGAVAWRGRPLATRMRADGTAEVVVVDALAVDRIALRARAPR
ncbi:MAG: hypothetical protein IPM29_24035 [Planctomycetes bacterium]|nr:hypothetical protein [Planctomycetota bacterium]